MNTALAPARQLLLTRSTAAKRLHLMTLVAWFLRTGGPLLRRLLRVLAFFLSPACSVFHINQSLVFGLHCAHSAFSLLLLQGLLIQN